MSLRNQTRSASVIGVDAFAPIDAPLPGKGYQRKSTKTVKTAQRERRGRRGETVETTNTQTRIKEVSKRRTKRSDARREKGMQCIFTPPVHDVYHPVSTAAVAINVNVKTAVHNSNMPPLWKAACLAEFIITERTTLESLPAEPKKDAKAEHNALMEIEDTLDMTHLASRTVANNIDAVRNKQAAGIIDELIPNGNDLYDVYKNVEYSGVEDKDKDKDKDSSETGKSTVCKSGTVCFSWKGETRKRLNTHTVVKTTYSREQMDVTYGETTTSLDFLVDDRLRTLRFNDLDIPTVWIPSIRKREKDGMKRNEFHCLNLTGANELGAMDKFATILVVRDEPEEFEWYQKNFTNAHTFLVTLPKRTTQQYCVGDAKNWAYLCAKHFKCERMILMDDGVHGFEHNSIIAYNDDHQLVTNAMRKTKVDLMQKSMLALRNRRFPITFSTAFRVMDETMTITGAGIVASDTKGRNDDFGSHCSQFVNRYSDSGRLPNQVWMINVKAIEATLNTFGDRSPLPLVNHIASPLHPAYQAGEDILMNMVLFQRGIRVTTLTSIRHRKWAGGTCSTNQSENWNPFTPIVKYMDMYRLLAPSTIFGKEGKKNPPRGAKVVATTNTSSFTLPNQVNLVWTTKPNPTSAGGGTTLLSYKVGGAKKRTSFQINPVIQCQRVVGGNPLRWLHQTMAMKGYGLRWWQTLVCIHAWNEDQMELETIGALPAAYTNAIQIQLVAGSKHKPVPWLARYNDQPVFVKEFATEAAASKGCKFQLFIDGIKSQYGLVAMDLHLTNDDVKQKRLLVGKDLGHGTALKVGVEGVKLVDKASSGSPTLEFFQDKLDDNGLDDVIKVLLFRAIWNVSDTHFKNIVWSVALHRVASVDETGQRKNDLLSLSTTGWTFYWAAMSGTKTRMKKMNVSTRDRIQKRICVTRSALLVLLENWALQSPTVGNPMVVNRCARMYAFYSSVTPM